MRIERKILLAGLVVLLLLNLAGAREASAFYTYRLWGGAIHKIISQEGLKSAGLSESSFDVVDAGNTSQDRPGTPQFSEPTHHFLDDQVKGSYDYIEERFNVIAGQVGKAHKDKKARYAVLYAFGELLHTSQDFYAHTNYLELQLKKNKSTIVYDMPLVDWKSVFKRDGNGRPIQASWFYYMFIGSNEGTCSRSQCISGIQLDHPESVGQKNWFEKDDTYHTSCAAFDGYVDYAISGSHKLLHYDVNKDDPNTPAGKRIIPSNKSTVYSYAATLAQMETTRTWKRLEDLVRKKYPKDAEKIILALKNYGQKDDLSGEWIIRNQTTGQISLINLMVDDTKVTAEGKGSWKGTLKGDEMKINRPVTKNDRTNCRPKVPPVKVFENALKFSPALGYEMKVISPDRMEGEMTGPYIEWNDKTNLVTKFQRGTPDKVTWERKGFADEDVNLAGEWTVTNKTSGAISTVKIKVNGKTIIAEGKKKWTGTLGNGELKLARDITMADRTDSSPTPPESAYKEALSRKPKAQHQLVIVSPTRMEGQLTSPWMEWNTGTGKLTKYVDTEADNVIWEKK